MIQCESIVQRSSPVVRLVHDQFYVCDHFCEHLKSFAVVRPFIKLWSPPIVRQLCKLGRTYSRSRRATGCMIARWLARLKNGSCDVTLGSHNARVHSCNTRTCCRIRCTNQCESIVQQSSPVVHVVRDHFYVCDYFYEHLKNVAVVRPSGRH